MLSLNLFKQLPCMSLFDFFDFSWLAGWRPRAGTLCLLGVLVAGGGCGKSESSAPPFASSPVTNSGPAAAAPTATAPQARMQPSVPSVSPNVGVTQLQMLNRAMLGWEMTNHRHPRTFEEFASTAGIQVPNPPAGQKYAFNQRGFIVLVNSSQ